MKSFGIFFIGLLFSMAVFGQIYTHADTLRGTLNANRTWWDVQKYNLYIIPDFNTKTLIGTNKIDFKTLRSGNTMQIDLQEPLSITKIIFEEKPLTNIKRDGNAYLITFANILPANKNYSIIVHFEGKPIAAKNAPWDGGLVWAMDKKKRPWISTACQGLGASVWWPCKDHQSDEPDLGAYITFETDAKQVSVSNGTLIQPKKKATKGAETWQVKNPINNYDICMNIGNYLHVRDTFMGEAGVLNLDYFVLDYNVDTAVKHFKSQVKPMLKAMEYWFGAYPFYEDGYKLVETPFLGMEHQSAVAYGNQFMMGYLGKDLSGSGWGNKWDFIIVHESGHEWFGNNITTNDIADMWVHEGFTDYSETLYVEYHYGKKAASAYIIGLRNAIINDKPIIGPYNVNKEGSGDMYFKGANMIHTIRQVIDNDTIFRSILRGLNTSFRHKTVTTQQIESYISRNAKKDLSKIFDQYLRTTKIPKLIVTTDKEVLTYKWENVIPGFNMPVKLKINGLWQWITPTTQPQTINAVKKFELNKEFYIDYN